MRALSIEKYGSYKKEHVHISSAGHVPFFLTNQFN
jgi:hypothetical protein